MRSGGWCDGNTSTAKGDGGREQMEVATDRQLDGPVAALGDDLDELVDTLARWGRDPRAAGGVPQWGSHDLASANR
jgi:hypothetical protein